MPNENVPTSLTGRYIYGIILGANDFQTVGIDDNPVYTVFYQDIGALVHNCLPQAYESNDREQVEQWLRQHQQVLEEVLKATDSLVPMSFDVIIDGTSEHNPDDLLKEWLQKRYHPLKEMLEQFAGQVEYGIKIYYSLNLLTEKVTRENSEIIELNNRLNSMSKGMAYLFRSELSQKIRKAVEAESLTIANEISAKIRTLVMNVRENKLESEITNHQKPILNLAVLANPDRVAEIGNYLEILETEGPYAILFTGPWPAYSFVKEMEQ